MRDELERTRKRFAYFSVNRANPITGMHRARVVNNSASVAARVARVMAAMDEAEQLKVELADQTDVPKILGELAAALPIVDDPVLEADA